MMEQSASQTPGRGGHALSLAQKSGCPARIRTSIDGVRVRSLTIRGRGNEGRASRWTLRARQAGQSAMLAPPALLR